MAADMTPYEQAQAVARRVGLDFQAALHEHLERGYIYSSPECFIMALDAEHNGELAVFVTLAVGSLDHFVSIDPRRDERRWLGFKRSEDGEFHWIDFHRLMHKAQNNQTR